MPIYEYECQNCSREFECLVTMQNTRVTCPDCNGADVKRLISLTHYRHADHWMANVQNGLKKSLEKDEIKAELKKKAKAAM